MGKVDAALKKANNALNQIALKSDKTYVDELVSTVNASPKGVYATSTDLQSAFPTGNANIYLVTADGHWYYWNESAWTQGGVYQSTGITDNSIVPEKLAVGTEFNVRNVTALRNSVMILENNSVLEDVEIIPGYLHSNGVVDTFSGMQYTKTYIPVLPGDTYLISGSGGYSASGLCYYGKNKNFISGVNVTTIDNTIITIPNNVFYIRCGTITANIGTFGIIQKSNALQSKINLIKSNFDSSVLKTPGATQSEYETGALSLTGSGGNNVSYSITSLPNDVRQFVKSVSVKSALGDKSIDLYKISYHPTLYNNIVVEFVKTLCILKHTSAGEILTHDFETPIVIPAGHVILVHGGSFYFTTSAGNVDGKLVFAQATGIYSRTTIRIAAKVVLVDSIENDVSKLINDLQQKDDEIELLSTSALVATGITDLSVQDIKASAISYPYKEVFHDAFKQPNTNWLDASGSWVFDTINGTLKPTVTGTNIVNNVILNKKYHADKRLADVKVSFKSDTIMDISFNNANPAYTDGCGTYRIDIPNLKIYMYNGHSGTSVVGQADIDIPIVVDREYVVSIERNNVTCSVKITDYLTGASCKAEYTGFGVNRQMERYSFSLLSGEAFTIKDMFISIMDKPLIVVVGDSISDGNGPTDYNNRYADLLRDKLKGNLIISARGNDSAPSIVDKFDSEYKFIKPTYLLWAHGFNGEGITSARLAEVKALCDTYGIILLVNHMTCATGDVHIERNAFVDAGGFRGCRFDIATARDHNPYLVEGDAAIRADASLYKDVSIHPNDAGNIKMFERFEIDLPELFSR